MRLRVTDGCGVWPTFAGLGTSLNKTSAGPIGGTFNGMPEGHLLTLSNRQLRLSYVGGTGGNDVTLTVLPPPNLGVTVSPAGAGHLATSIQARSATCNPNSQLVSIQFTKFLDASVDGAGLPAGLQTNGYLHTFTAPGPASHPFTVNRLAPGAATVLLLVSDGCAGPWETFVGLGANVP